MYRKLLQNKNKYAIKRVFMGNIFSIVATPKNYIDKIIKVEMDESCRLVGSRIYGNRIILIFEELE